MASWASSRRDQLGPCRPTRSAVGAVALLAGEVGEVDGAAEAGPLLVGLDTHRQPAPVLAAERLVGDRRRRGRTEGPGRVAGRGGEVLGQAGRLQRQRGGQHLDLDVLAPTAAAPGQQGGEHAFDDRRGGGEVEVGEVAEHLAVAAGRTGDRRPAAERLQQRVDAGLGRHRADPAVGGGRDVDDPGVDPGDLVVAQAQLLDRAGPHVLDEHVAVLDDPQRLGPVVVVLQVEGDRRACCSWR